MAETKRVILTNEDDDAKVSVETKGAKGVLAVEILDASGNQIVTFGGVLMPPADGTYIGDIKFGESLPAGTATIGNVNILTNTNKNGAGTAYYPVVDSDGHFQIDALTLPAITIAANQTLTTVTTVGTVTTITNVVHIDDNSATLSVDGTVTANLSATDNAVLDAIALGFATEGDALADGVLIQGDDGTDRTNVLVDAAGHLQVDVLSGGGGGTLVIDNQAVNAADTGILVLGTDGSNYQILSTDATGHLQVDVLSGGGGGTQYAEGATPNPATGTAIMFESNTGTHAIAIVNATTPLPVTATQGSAGAASWLVSVSNAAGAAAVNIQDGGNAITVDGSVTADTELPAAAALADGVANNPTVPTLGAVGLMMNAAAGTLDRQRSVYATQDTTGTGIAASGICAQLDDTSTAGVTENQFAPLRMSSRRALLVEGVASGTTIPVTASIAAAQTLATVTTVGTVTTITNVVHIDDNASAITVDGTVTANLSATDNAVLDTIDSVLDTINAKLVTGTVIGDVNLGATDNAVLDTIDAVLDTINAKLVTGTVIGDVNLGATDNAVLDTMVTALQLIDNAVSGAGYNITQLGGAAVPIGAGLEATAVRVTLPTNGTGVVKISDGTETALVDASGNLMVNLGVKLGATTDTVSTTPAGYELAGVTTHTKKYYTAAGAVTDGIIWSPAAGKRWYVTDIFINVSAAATVTLEDDLAAGDSAIWKAELAANSGWSHSFQTPWYSGEDAADLIITTTAGNVYVTVTGYEI